MASGLSNVEERRGERTLKTRSKRRRRSSISKYSFPQQCAQEDVDFSHLFRPSEEWCGVSGEKDNLVDGDGEIGMGWSGAEFTLPDSYLVVDLSKLRSKQEVRKLKRRLTEELEQVRDVAKLFNGRTATRSDSSMGGDDGMETDEDVGVDGNPMHVHSGMAPVQGTDEGFASVSGRIGQKAAKILNQAHRTMEVTNGVVSKESIPLSRSVGNSSARVSQSDYFVEVFKSCKSLLIQLMKHKCGWVFNEPVDAVRFNLYDYHTVIKHPMDLGTVKERLTTNLYESPMEFAEDVRLTFRNALTYNPKGHEVHVMAEQLLEIFEENWILIEDKYKHHMENNIDCDVDLAAPGSDVDLVAPASERISHPSTPSMRTSGAFESSFSEMPANSPSISQEMVEQMPEVQLNTPSIGMLDGMESSPGETPINSASPFQEAIPDMHDIQQITPSTRTANALEFNSSEKPVECAYVVQEFVPGLVEVHKDMSLEEKQKLNASIQELPPIKLGVVVDIIKKKNSALFQNEDEVELDINFLDAETLWELKCYVLECISYSVKTERKMSANLDCMQHEKVASKFHPTFEEQFGRNIKRQIDNGSKSSNSVNYLYSSSRGMDHFEQSWLIR